MGVKVRTLTNAVVYFLWRAVWAGLYVSTVWFIADIIEEVF
jgi:hypothetical protein